MRGAQGAVDRLPRDPVLITVFLSGDPRSTLERLKCSRAEIERGAWIGRYRGTEPSGEDPVEVRRWLARVGPAADDLLAITTTEGRDTLLSAAVADVRTSGAPLELGQLAIDGNTLRDMGLAEGPLLGSILRQLLEDVLVDPSLNETEHLIARARQLAATQEC